MAQSRSQDNWNHTAALLAMMANVNRDRKKKPTPFKPADFSPYVSGTKKTGMAVTSQNIGMLKQAFVDRRTERTQIR